MCADNKNEALKWMGKEQVGGWGGGWGGVAVGVGGKERINIKQKFPIGVK